MLGKSFLEYITRLAKADVTINGTLYSARTRVTISPCFFRDFVCQGCGKCCRVNTHLFYTLPEMLVNNISPDDLRNQGFVEAPLTIESLAGKHAEVLFVSKWNVQTKCPWQLADNKCMIHDTKPIQCTLTPLHLDYNKRTQTVRLTKRLFGRNWRFGCPMIKVPTTPEILDADMKKLMTLYLIAESFGIDTWIPEIITKLASFKNPENPVWVKGDFRTVIVNEREGALI